jgi:hypothetical protein
LAIVGITPLIVNLGITARRKIIFCSLNRKMSGLHIRSEHVDENTKPETGVV